MHTGGKGTARENNRGKSLRAWALGPLLQEPRGICRQGDAGKEGNTVTSEKANDHSRSCSEADEPTLQQLQIHIVNVRKGMQYAS